MSVVGPPVTPNPVKGSLAIVRKFTIEAWFWLAVSVCSVLLLVLVWALATAGL
jgi:hypothetical protein